MAGRSNKPEDTATRHDYARIWRRLKPGERDRRICEALDRLAEGETLARVAATWSIQASALCRALLAYAPLEWRRALTARALVRYQQAADSYAADPRNPIARARAWRTRWYLEHALKVLARTDIELQGNFLVGPCPYCRERSVYARIGRGARCYACGWEDDDAKQYLREQLQGLTGGASRRARAS